MELDFGVFLSVTSGVGFFLGAGPLVFPGFSDCFATGAGLPFAVSFFAISLVFREGAAFGDFSTVFTALFLAGAGAFAAFFAAGAAFFGKTGFLEILAGAFMGLVDEEAEPFLLTLEASLFLEMRTTVLGFVLGKAFDFFTDGLAAVFFATGFLAGIAFLGTALLIGFFVACAAGFFTVADTTFFAATGFAAGFFFAMGFVTGFFLAGVGFFLLMAFGG